jgi:hypothetical protein
MIFIVKHDTYENFYIFLDKDKAINKIEILIETDWNILKNVMSKEKFDKEPKWYVSTVLEGQKIEGEIYI